jgi:choline dehydrogenase-like flavoprotein
VVASRLTEDRQFSVLLVEAGPKCVLPGDGPIFILHLTTREYIVQ